MNKCDLTGVPIGALKVTREATKPCRWKAEVTREQHRQCRRRCPALRSASVPPYRLCLDQWSHGVRRGCADRFFEEHCSRLGDRGNDSRESAATGFAERRCSPPCLLYLEYRGHRGTIESTHVGFAPRQGEDFGPGRQTVCVHRTWGPPILLHGASGGSFAALR